MNNIPLVQCYFGDREIEYVLKAISSHNIDGGGEFTTKCEDYLQGELNSRRVLLTTSCTSALEMAAILIDVQPGDEIIIPSFTFVSTANAFVLRGGRPVFCDVRPDTLNIDEAKLRSLVTPRTKAIVPVHYAGVGCEMNSIVELAREHSIRVIEDNAHGLFGKYRGKYLGTFGCLAAQSFDRAKNFTCGEGGALVVNDEELAGRAEIVRDKGTNRASFLRGEVDKYTWVDLGSNLFPSELQAGYLYSQLQSRQQIQNKRYHIWHYYNDNLREWAARNEVKLPQVPAHCEQSYHLYYLLMPSLGARDALIRHLGSLGITGAFHYLPLHLSEMGVRAGGNLGDCPVAEEVSERIIRLPYFNDLSDCDLERTIAAVIEFFP